ncbi:chemotaxis protein CheR [Clostridium tertium]|uniref:protein-glutamate O-methyltransferase n=1 Tax=Clostridium tertium TaxID=1559 RepID=A0A6N3EUJ3_9CLOT
MDFTEFHNWIYKEYKINLNAYKPEQLNRRIGSLMSRVGISSLDDYKKLLITNKEEREKFIDFITINVTEFFRNTELFAELQKILKEYCVLNPRLKIWSAACSIGCEPYSLAMIVSEISPKVNATILATDLDNNILKRAIEGEYLPSEMKNVNEDFKRRYFKEVDGKFIIDNRLKSMIKFKRHDLILDTYEKDFDLIVCRNVVIYFKKEIKDEIFKRFSESLKKGGMLFVGATESIYNYKDFGLEKLSTFIYKKI